MTKTPIFTRVSLETDVNKYHIQTCHRSVDLSNGQVLSTSVFYRKSISERDQIVHISQIYRSAVDAVKGHQRIASDVARHSEKYTVEKWSKKAERLMKDKR